MLVLNRIFASGECARLLGVDLNFCDVGVICSVLIGVRFI